MSGPASANPTAAAKPIPLDPPVMNETLSYKEKRALILGRVCFEKHIYF